MNNLSPLEVIFFAALEKGSPVERAAFLDEVCAGDAELRGRVEKMLSAQADAGSFLESPAAGVAPTLDLPPIAPLTEEPGTVIGPYKLLEQIGEGGFGVVFMAEQERPVRRRVALKVIKPGMDTHDVIARFEAERQALALMDHPNIARVYDAGATQSGRPYFVMELVKGIPITEYCDRYNLPPRERLELFATVCQAVQHAHHKGVIHRDIKPSNVLVTLHDGRPVPKVIDFGLAKAMHQRLTDKTLFTQFAQMLGTPLYMSPEQAEHSGLDIDTRSDVYSLGAMLYELLTGSTPFTRQRLRDAALGEILRMIREEEPPRPSLRLSSLGDKLAGIAAHRHTEPKKLGPLMRSELDWIVMKALEKDRGRRYETANAFAADVQRYLNDEPVLACPPSAGYRLRKFVRRNKGAVVAASVSLLLLLGGIIGTTWGLVRAEQARRAETERAEAEANQRRRAETAEQQAKANEQQAQDDRRRAEQEQQTSQAVRDFLQKKLLAQADPRFQANALLEAGNSAAEVKPNPTIRELLDRAAQELTPDKIEAQFPKQPLVQAEILQTIGETYGFLGEVETAIHHLMRAHDLRARHLGPDHRNTLTSLGYLAAGYMKLGDSTKAIPLLEQVRDKLAASSDPDDPDLLIFQIALATAYQNSGKRLQAIPLLEQVRDRQLKKLGLDHAYTLLTLRSLASSYLSAGRQPEAIRLFEQVADKQAKTMGPDHIDTLGTQLRLAAAYVNVGKAPDALHLLEQVLDTSRLRLGPDHPFTQYTLEELARAYVSAGNKSEAIFLLEQLRDRSVATMGPDDPATFKRMSQLADAYRSAGRQPEAIELYEQVRDHQETTFGPDHETTLLTLKALGYAYRRAGRPLEAVRVLETACDRSIVKFGRAHASTVMMQAALADAFHYAGRLPEAIRLFEEIRASYVLKLGPDHRSTLGMLANMARAYRYAGRQPDAIRLLEDVYDKALRLPQFDHAFTQVVLENLAGSYGEVGQFDKAIAAYTRALNLAPTNDRVHGNLAWLLAVCPDPRLRDPPEAVRLAKKAVELSPKEGSHWNTLGVAHYRAGGWQAAVESLQKSIELRKGGDNKDWFFLAMAHWQLGNKDEARQWFDQAVEWTDKSQPQNEDLRHFRAEAEELLRPLSGAEQPATQPVEAPRPAAAAAAEHR